MIQQIKLAAFVLLIGIALALLLFGRCDGGDYTVSKGTTIKSQRPIWLLVTEAGFGVLNGRTGIAITGGGNTLEKISRAGVETALRIDGHPAPGIGGMVRAARRLVGFVIWDETGRIERTTTLSVRGHVVHVYDRVSNGSVRVRVTVGPPLGDPMVRYAVLELEATEDKHDGSGTGERILEAVCCRKRSEFGPSDRTRLQLSCSAVIDLPGDRCRLVRRIARRIAEREAGPELRSRVGVLSEVGLSAVLSGRDQIDEIVGEFLRRVCR